MRNTTTYKLAGPKTFRRSSTKVLDYWGSNLQNIQKSVRAIYHPDGFSPALASKCLVWLQTGDVWQFTPEELAKLRVFLQADQAGAEALIVAYDTEAGAYRQLFENNIKVHVYVAMKLFKDVWRNKLKEKGGLVEDFDIDQISETPIPELRNHPYWKELDALIKDSDNWSLQERYYYLAKQTVHSANYDIQAPHFRMNILKKSGGKIVISEDDSTRFLLIYRALFPEIPARNRRVQQQVERGRIIWNMLGFPYQITDYNILTTAMKDAIAWGPQSTVGEITRIAFTNLQNYIEQERKKWDILADTHDSYLAQCPLNEVRECRSKMLEFMCQDLVSPVDGTKFKMKAECNIGFNWCPKKEGNPLGLQELEWLND